MSSDTATILFLIVWLITMAYVLSVVRLDFAVRAMKRRGELLDAPALFKPIEGFRGIAWLLGGRFEKMGDETVARWARIARILFYVSAPLILLVFVVNFVAILT